MAARIDCGRDGCWANFELECSVAVRPVFATLNLVGPLNSLLDVK